MAINQEGGWTDDPFSQRAINKAVSYGNKWLDSKINYGINYLENYARQFDVLGVFPSQWTILNENADEAFSFDVFLNANIRSEVKVTQMPVENGSFVAFNMVGSPLEINCVLAKRGFPQDLRVYTEALFTLVDSTDLVSIITPEREYSHMKLTKVNFDRTSDTGTDIIYAECNFVEIRQVSSQYTNARVARKVSRGQQQGTDTSLIAGGLDYTKGVISKIGRL